MRETLEGPIKQGWNVAAIAKTADRKRLKVTMDGKDANGRPVRVDKEYASVISTVSLSCLSHIDLTGCGIAGVNYPQWSAIRELQYGAAIKVGINFKRNWWSELTTGGIIGGQSYTDMPVRTM